MQSSIKALFNLLHAGTFNTFQEFLANKSGFPITAITSDEESREYHAYSFIINGYSIIYRQSKITPTKTGQFVTVWKRDSAGITQPFDVKDDVDFIIIASQMEIKLGLGGSPYCGGLPSPTGIFIFPKQVLLEQGIISNKDKGGKRGIRVYPPWDVAESKQAIKTQKWQTRHFYHLNNDVNIAAIAGIFA